VSSACRVRLFVAEQSTREAPAPQVGDVDLDPTLAQLLPVLDFELDQLRDLVEQAAPESSIAARAQQPRSCLVVGLPHNEAEPLSDVISSHGFQVDAARPNAALALVEAVAFDLLLVRLPLPGMAFEEFLEAVRQPKSRCQGANLFILANPGELDTAERFLGHGANRVVDLARPAPILSQAIGNRMRIASRVRVRCALLVRPPAGVPGGSQFCQTFDISETGMSVETSNPLPNGMRFKFALTLPGNQPRIKGEAEVVRHATNRESFKGFGARIVSHDDRRSRDRLRDFIRSHVTAAKS